MNNVHGLGRSVTVVHLSHLDVMGFLGTLHFRLRFYRVLFFVLFFYSVWYIKKKWLIAVTFTREKNTNWPFFHLLFLKNANAITFIVVYIFNNGRCEIVSFNVESQFLNVSLSFFSCFFFNFAVGFFFLKQHLQKFDYIITTQTYFVYFMNQHFPSFPYTEMLQLSFLIFVQCNIKGKRERKQTKLSVVCLGVLWPFLRQSGKKSTMSR